MYRLAILILLVPCFALAADAPATPGWTAPEAPVVAPAAPERDGVFAAAASPKFGQVLNQAATEAWRNGDISRGDLARIRLAVMLRPRVIAECQSCVMDEGIQRGIVPSSAADNVSAFDWTQLLAFIKELLPMILQIISLFSSQASLIVPYAPLALAA
jgi:hypothetical protein